jgi:ubiquinone/menaquinone biosynthesis C-methylase UbiE
MTRKVLQRIKHGFIRNRINNINIYDTEMINLTLKEVELNNWSSKAVNYDGLLAAITNQAIAPVLNSLGNLYHTRFLDLACGTGNLSGAAFELGAFCAGIDFAPEMINLAGKKFPGVRYAVGDVENLPYKDEMFDVAACLFGLLHLEHPEKAVREAFRVLRTEGKYFFTSWCGPEQGGEYFGLIIDAIKKYGNFEFPIPDVPPAFKYADENEAANILLCAGFVNPYIRKIDLIWRPLLKEDVLDMLYKSIVRLTLVLEYQKDEIREKIHEEILSGAEKFDRKNGLEFIFPVIMASAEKP